MWRRVEATQVAHLAVTLRAAVVVGRLGAADVQFRLAERTVHFGLRRLRGRRRGLRGLLLQRRFLHVNRRLLALLPLGTFLLMCR